MASLPTDRTVDSTRQDHLADHAELARLHNLLDDPNAARDTLKGAKVVQSSAADVQVISTTAETDLRSLTLPAVPAVGDLYIADFAGTMLQNVGSNQNLTMRFYLGTTAYLVSNAQPLATGANVRQWNCRMFIFITDTTHQEIWGRLTIASGIAAGGWLTQGASAYDLSGWAQGLEDTTTAKAVKLTAVLQSNGGQQWMTCSVGVLSVLRA